MTYLKFVNFGTPLHYLGLKKYTKKCENLRQNNLNGRPLCWLETCTPPPVLRSWPGFDEYPTLPQIGVNPTSLQLLVFQHFWSFVTEIRSPMLANKFYKGGFFVNLIHFCCITNYQSISLIHHGIIALPSLDIFLTKCDQEKHFWAAW